MISLAAITSSAHSADMDSAGYDWSGFYFGLNAGAAMNDSNIENSFNYTGPLTADDFPPGYFDQTLAGIRAIGADLTSDETTFTGGALFGFNWQRDHLVLGLEGDINYVGFGDSETRDRGALLDGLFNEQPGTISASHKLSYGADWYGTLRGRMGYAADNLLIYGTGGLAYGDMEANSKFEASAGAESGSWKGSADAINWGWTLGVGAEYGIDNWSFGAEYLYVDLGTVDWTSNGNVELDNNSTEAALEDIAGKGDFDYQFSVVRATAKMRF